MDSWVYLSEGGKHVIFSSTARQYTGRLLRVSRDDLVQVAAEHVLSSSSDQSLDKGNKDEAESQMCTRIGTNATTDASMEFLRRIVHPRLEPYFDIPETVELLPEVASDLMKQAIASEKIPLARKSAWIGPCQTGRQPDTDASKNVVLFATLMYDCKRITGHDKADWSVEIKPKAGYITFSPFVHPKHRIKFLQSRFSIQQQLLARGIVRKGWISGVTQVSDYNPLDLFSANSEKVEKAMKALLLTPQNNLRIWCGDDLVFGHEVANISDEQTKYLITVLTAILCEEDVLEKLRAMQLLDVIDADGAVIIYNHMVQLCSGSQEEADQLLDQVPEQVMSSQIGTGCLGGSPFPRPQSPAVDRLLSEVEHFSQSSPTEENCDEATSHIQVLVHELSKLDCIFLLQNWLLSLAMCDVSVMIAVVSVEGTSLSENIEWSGERKQDVSHCGLLKSGTRECMYAVKVIDCENKPANKLSTRAEKESLIRKL